MRAQPGNAAGNVVAATRVADHANNLGAGAGLSVASNVRDVAGGARGAGPAYASAAVFGARGSRASGPPTLAGRSVISTGVRASSLNRPHVGQANASDSLQSLLDSQLAPNGGSHWSGGNLQMKRASMPSGSLDFDDEARKLWARLNLDPSMVSSGPYNALDPLWRHPQSGGTFFVGNQTAAANFELLQKYKIHHVVNCTDSMPLYHEKTGRIKYHRFDITSFYRRVHTDEDAVVFVQPMLSFVEAALSGGHNVMAHCLAGAHRAGTTGVICLMHFAQLSAREAVPVAKRCRPIIDPIGEFPELLAKIERGWRANGQGNQRRNINGAK